MCSIILFFYMTEVIVQLIEDVDATSFYGVNNVNIRIFLM